jgi:hypothetical protein
MDRDWKPTQGQLKALSIKCQGTEEYSLKEEVQWKRRQDLSDWDLWEANGEEHVGKGSKNVTK